MSKLRSWIVCAGTVVAATAAAQKVQPAAPTAPSAPAAKPTPPAPASAPAAQAADTAAPPTPPPELAQLDYFKGSWRCDITQRASQWGPEHAFKATVKIKPALGDFWLAIEYKEKPSKVHPLAVESVVYWGYDPVARAFVGSTVDNTGGRARGKSRGWDGDKIVWIHDAHVMGMNMGIRETYAKVGPREVKTTYEVALKKGQWALLAEGICKR